MSEYIDPAVINKQTDLADGPVSKHIENLIEVAKLESNDGNISETTKVALLEQFYGSVLRAQGTVSGSETLDLLAMVANRNGDIRDEEGKPRVWPEVFTRKCGIRRSIKALHDELGDKLFVPTGLRYVDGNRQLPILGSMDMIHGYLETETEAEANLSDQESAVTWKETILQELQKYLDIDGRSEAWASRQLLGSEIASVKADQTNWERSVEIAKKAGIDFDLITRSVEFIRELKLSGITVGKAVLRIVPSYDGFFK